MQLALLAYAPAVIAAAATSAPSWTEPPVSPEVKAAMEKADAGQPGDLLALADAGRTDAQFYAGVMLIYGRAKIAQDGPKGCAYEVKASATRADAAHLVGLCWQNGLLGPRDVAKAEAAYTRASQMGFPKSRCALGAMLMGEPGQGDRGAALCKESGKAGDVESQLIVADAYFYGRGVAVDRKEARKWYQMAADAKNPQGMRRFGEMLASGDGGKKDTKKALALWQAGEKAGDPLVCILVADQLFSDMTGGKTPGGGTYAFKGGVPTSDIDAITAWYQEAQQADPRPDVKQRAARALQVLASLKSAAVSVSKKKK
jgi:TPR repeat protein